MPLLIGICVLDAGHVGTFGFIMYGLFYEGGETNQSSVVLPHRKISFYEEFLCWLYFILWMKYLKYFKSVDPLELQYLLYPLFSLICMD